MLSDFFIRNSPSSIDVMVSTLVMEHSIRGRWSTLILVASLIEHCILVRRLVAISMTGSIIAIRLLVGDSRNLIDRDCLHSLLVWGHLGGRLSLLIDWVLILWHQKVTTNALMKHKLPIRWSCQVSCLLFLVDRRPHLLDCRRLVQVDLFRLVSGLFVVHFLSFWTAESLIEFEHLPVDHFSIRDWSVLDYLVLLLLERWLISLWVLFDFIFRLAIFNGVADEVRALLAIIFKTRLVYLFRVFSLKAIGGVFTWLTNVEHASLLLLRLHALLLLSVWTRNLLDHIEMLGRLVQAQKRWLCMQLFNHVACWRCLMIWLHVVCCRLWSVLGHWTAYLSRDKLLWVDFNATFCDKRRAFTFIVWKLSFFYLTIWGAYLLSLMVWLNRCQFIVLRCICNVVLICWIVVHSGLVTL